MAEIHPHIDEIDGAPVSWLSAPAPGTPALYVHGVPNSSLMWRPFLERTGGLLAKDVVQPVGQHGHGYSTPISNASPRWSV